MFSEPAGLGLSEGSVSALANFATVRAYGVLSLVQHLKQYVLSKLEVNHKYS